MRIRRYFGNRKEFETAGNFGEAEIRAGQGKREEQSRYKRRIGVKGEKEGLREPEGYGG